MHVCFNQSASHENQEHLANWWNSKRKKKANGRKELKTHSTYCTQQREKKTGGESKTFRIFF